MATQSDGEEIPERRLFSPPLAATSCDAIVIDQIIVRHSRYAVPRHATRRPRSGVFRAISILRVTRTSAGAVGAAGHRLMAAGVGR